MYLGCLRFQGEMLHFVLVILSLGKQLQYKPAVPNCEVIAIPNTPDRCEGSSTLLMELILV